MDYPCNNFVSNFSLQFEKENLKVNNNESPDMEIEKENIEPNENNLYKKKMSKKCSDQLSDLQLSPKLFKSNSIITQ